MNNYKQETGAVISQNKSILHLVDGTGGSVTFPAELILNLHALSPGCIYSLVHIHPPGMQSMSNLDEQMLKGWAMTLDPFPIRLTVITQIEQGTSDVEIPFKETCWIANLEPKETWINRGKEGARKIEIIKEWERFYWHKIANQLKDKDYVATLVERSYENEN